MYCIKIHKYVIFTLRSFHFASSRRLKRAGTLTSTCTLTVCDKSGRGLVNGSWTGRGAGARAL